MITRTVVSGEGSVLGIDKDHFAYHMAKDFFAKAISATNDLHKSKMDFSKNHWMVCFPVCTLAFSLELALKTFLTDEQLKKLRSRKNNKKDEGHLLLSLYNTIDADIQSKIEAHFDWCGPFKNTYDNMCFGPDSALPPSLSLSTKERIVNALEKANNAYVYFRYFHKLNPTKQYCFDFNTITTFTHACLAIRKEELGITDN